MQKGVAAECSYCTEFATFRITKLGEDMETNPYELHACPVHKKTAAFEFYGLFPEGTPSLVSNSGLGFPKPKVQTDES